MNEREVLIARADKYLNTGSGEYASEIMRDMAEFIRRTPQIARVAQGVQNLEAVKSAIRDEAGSRLCYFDRDTGDRRCYRDHGSTTCLCEDVAKAALLASPAQSSWQPSEQEQHAIGHARYQVERATPEFPEVCFDYELILTLLKIIDRTSPVPSTQSRIAED